MPDGNEEKESVFSCLESEIAFEEGTTELRIAAAECHWQRFDDHLHRWWNYFQEERINQLESSRREVK
jgi:hypothetical protein